MRVLVVGGGGREHALAWRLALCPSVEDVSVTPGNPGIGQVARCRGVPATDPPRLIGMALQERMDLVVIGPEAPLCAGLADHMRAEGLAVLGPSASAARIEGSKAWAMAFCHRHGLPAPQAQLCVTLGEALDVAAGWPLPAVIKADGLAAGKGVVVTADRAEAVEAARTLGARGPVVFEEFLEGREVSAFALCDGRSARFYGVARDHKRLLAGDLGPMTGGMGAFTPVPDVDAATLVAIRGILERTVASLASEGCPFVGFLFAGLMLTAEGPRVLEFNCRFGDPEAQSLLPLIGGDVALEWLAATRGELGGGQTVLRPGAAFGVVLAAPGYPAAPESGVPLAGLGPDGQVPGYEDVLCFHAATRWDGRWQTAGGRVLTLVGRGGDLVRARDRAYAAVEAVRFPGAQWRPDMGGAV